MSHFKKFYIKSDANNISADSDGNILDRRVATGLEHQTKHIDDTKLNQMGNYDTYLVIETHLPTFLPIATHLDPSKSKKTA